MTQIDGAMSVAVPPGWHMIRGWLTDVISPIPRLALASFPARLSRRTCTCGFPNVRQWPADGAFLFLWEYPAPSRRELRQLRARPRHLNLAGMHAIGATCQGSSTVLEFRIGRRSFQAELYIGRRAGPRRRARLIAVLESLRPSPGYWPTAQP